MNISSEAAAVVAVGSWYLDFVDLGDRNFDPVPGHPL